MPPGGEAALRQRYIDETISKMSLESLREIPHCKEGQDISTYLAMFKRRVASYALSDHNRITLLTSKLSGAVREYLADLGDHVTFDFAVDELIKEFGKEGLPALKASKDLSSYRQQEGETSFAFYVRYREALSNAGRNVKEELLDTLVDKLLPSVQEEIALVFAGGRSVVLEELIQVLKSLDKRLFPKAASVNTIKSYGGTKGKGAAKPAAAVAPFEGNCHHCGKKGHRKAECRSRLAGKPPTAQAGRGRGRGGGRGRGTPPKGSRGGGKGTPGKGHQPQQSQKQQKKGGRGGKGSQGATRDSQAGAGRGAGGSSSSGGGGKPPSEGKWSNKRQRTPAQESTTLVMNADQNGLAAVQDPASE